MDLKAVLVASDVKSDVSSERNEGTNHTNHQNYHSLSVLQKIKKKNYQKSSQKVRRTNLKFSYLKT